MKRHFLHHVGMLESTFEKILRIYENVYVLNNISKNEWMEELKFVEENWENAFTPDMSFNYKLRAFVIRLKEMSERCKDGKRAFINDTLLYTDKGWRFRWGEDDWRISPTRTVDKHFGWEIHPYYTDIVRKNFWFLNDLFDFGVQNYAKINSNTLLVYRYEPEYSPEDKIYRLGNTEFTHGVVIGYNRDGIQDCPYSKESLKFLVKKI